MLGMTMTALADETRRRIYEIVIDGPSSVRRITDQVAVSQPAVSQHLKVLREAGLVESTPRGASNIYTARREGLAELRAWLDAKWDVVLDAFVEESERRT